MKQDLLLKQKIGLRLSRVGSLSKAFAIQNFVNDEHELTPEQYSILTIIKDNNGIYLRQIATISFKDRPNITRIVGILENKKYVKSVIDVEKRQVKKLFITDLGLQICNKIEPTILRIWEETQNNISQEDINKFLSVLEMIENNLREKTILQN